MQTSDVDPDLAHRSRTVDSGLLGQRIRAARLAAGLTQAEAASGTVTAAYISRIEIGNRRPDVQLLVHLAAKLRTTVEALVDGTGGDELAALELELGHAELSLRTGDPATALSKVHVVLESELALQPKARQLVTHAQHLRAEALEALGRHREAIGVLEKVVVATSRGSRWLRAQIGLSRCYRETGDLSRAVTSGREALDVAKGLGLANTDEAIQLTLTVAAALYEQGDVDLALTACREALVAADQIASPIAQASAYWNASLIQTRQGEVADALPLARKAVGIMERCDDHRNLARLRTALAGIQLRLDPPDLEGAEASATQALSEMQWTESSTVDKLRVQLTLAKVSYLAGRLEDARRTAMDCLESAVGKTPLLAAEAGVVLGRVHLAGGALSEARSAFQGAVLALTGIGADRKAAEMWFELGGLLQEVGDQDGALDAYRRAAASTGISQPTGLGLPSRVLA